MICCTQVCLLIKADPCLLCTNKGNLDLCARHIEQQYIAARVLVNLSPSPLCCGILQGTDSNLVVKNAYAKYNLSLGVGLTKVAGKVFRIGHLGNMDEVMLLGALAGTEMALIDAGIKIEPGSGVKEAVKYFQETSSVIPTRQAPPKMQM